MILALIGGFALQFRGRRPACEAKHYEPKYLPEGVAEVPFDNKTSYDWFRTWEGKNISIKIIGGLTGDPGSDPAAKPVRGLGYDAHIGPIGPGIIAVDWLEIPSSTCAKRYVVSAKGLTEAEVIRIARSLHD